MAARGIYGFALMTVLMFCPTSFAQDDIWQQQKEQVDRMQPQMIMMRMNMLVRSKGLQEELGVVPDQIKEIQSIVQDFQIEINEANQGMMEKQLELQELVRSGKHELAQEMAKDLQKAHLDVCKEHLKLVEETLLPHQMNRMKQIAKQEMYKNLSGYGDEFGLPLAIADELGLSREQQKELQKAIDEAREEYYEKQAKLKERAHEAILRSIPADKRAEVKELLGDIYDVEQENIKMRSQGGRRRFVSGSEKKSDKDKQ